MHTVATLQYVLLLLKATNMCSPWTSFIQANAIEGSFKSKRSLSANSSTTCNHANLTSHWMWQLTVSCVWKFDELRNSAWMRLDTKKSCFYNLHCWSIVCDVACKLQKLFALDRVSCTQNEKGCILCISCHVCVYSCFIASEAFTSKFLQLGQRVLVFFDDLVVARDYILP